MTQIIKDKGGKLFSLVNMGHWSATAPIECKEGSPIHRWHGKKIQPDQWRQVLAFFLWSLEETKSEAMIHGYYHEEHGWHFLVLPQKGYTGMTVKLIEDHEGLKEAEATLPGVWKPGEPWDEKYNAAGKWERRCTVHHHCRSSAFQSGTDHADEKNKEGLHITIGKLDEAKFDIHARCTPPPSIKGEMTPVEYSDWFDLDPNVAVQVPAELHGILIAHNLVRPPTNREFPEWWKKNVIRVAEPAQTMGYGMSQLPSHYQGNHYVGPGSGNHQRFWRKSGPPTQWDIDKFHHFVQVWMDEWRYTATEALEMLDSYGLSMDKEIANDITEFADLMADCEMRTCYAAAILKEMAKREAAAEAQEEFNKADTELEPKEPIRGFTQAELNEIETEYMGGGWEG